jgi:signal transduction histidine kinase
MRANLRSLPRAIVIASVCAGLTVVLRFGSSELLAPQRVPLFLPLIVAVFAAAWYGGWMAGFLTTALGVALGTVLPNSQSTAVEGAALRRLGPVLFVMEGLAISASLEAMHRARRRLGQKKAQLEKEVQERLHAEQELVAAASRKNEFLATMAHELRNPLAPLSNGVTILHRSHGDPEVANRVLPIMKRQLSHMVRLVDDLLDVARITRDKVTLRKQAVDLVEIVRSALETSQPVIQASDHEVTVDWPQAPIIIEGDFVRLNQVFANLLNNAARYTERGGRIRVALCREGSSAVVRVKDSGIGIPGDMLPRVFEMFTQVSRSELSQDGLGIGLSLAKRFVEMHGGTIEAYSEGSGKGSEFVVYLPVEGWVLTAC